MKALTQHLSESISFDIDLENDAKQYEKENPTTKYKVKDFFKDLSGDNEVDSQILRVAKKCFSDFLKYKWDQLTVPFKDCYMHIWRNPKPEMPYGGYRYGVILSKSPKAPTTDQWKSQYSGTIFHMEGGMYHGSGVQMVKYFLKQMGEMLQIVIDKSNIQL